jgi:hypothetical protein
MVAEVSERERGDFGELDVDRLRQFVITQQGRDYVLSDGLLDGLHAVSGGYFDVETHLEQLPDERNGMLAVCSARVTIFAPDDPDRVLRSATGLGDASPQSVNRMIAPHLVRMAETRAVSRALRTLLNVGAVSFEELGPRAEPEDAPAPAPPAPAPVEQIVVEGKRYTRPQVLGAYRARLAEARRVQLQLGEVGGQGGPPLEDAPLSVLVEFTQGLKRRLEARTGATATGK